MDLIINGVLGKNQQNNLGIYEYIRKTKTDKPLNSIQNILYVPRVDILYTSIENLNKLNEIWMKL